MAFPTSARSPLDRFLGALHRRSVAQRLLERTGLGVLGGCGCAALLLPLLFWQDRPALPVVIGALCFGGGLGFLWGAARRPTLLEAAMEADRQLGLKDLLGTAAAVGASGAARSDPWAAVVLSLADERCRSLRPRTVLLHRLGARAWGGIGLAMAAVLAGALLAGSPSGTRAAALRSDAAAEAATNAAQPPAPPEQAERPLIALAPGPLSGAPEQEDPDANSTAGRTSGVKPPGAEAGPDASRPKGNEEGPSKSDNAGSPGAGGGSAQTHVPPKPVPPAPNDASAGSDTASPPNRPAPAGTAVKPAPGGSGPSDHPSRQSSASAGATGGTSAGPNRPSRTTPPWQTDAWPTDVRRAHEALDAGQIPPAYQEMVRRYFDRP